MTADAFYCINEGTSISDVNIYAKMSIYTKIKCWNLKEHSLTLIETIETKKQIINQSHSVLTNQNSSIYSF